MIMVVGLGNPGAQYEKTRHNVGFDAIDVLAKKYGIELQKKQGQAIVGSGYCEGQKVLLVKPLTYMNLSGHSIKELLEYYKLDAENELIVLFDDISLNPGDLRIKGKGSAGGHNGIKDVIAMTGTSAFSRVKIGVGAKPPQWDLTNYVLSRFSAEDRQKVDEALNEVPGIIALMVTNRKEEAMNRFNRKKTVEDE